MEDQEDTRPLWPMAGAETAPDLPKRVESPDVPALAASQAVPNLPHLSQKRKRRPPKWALIIAALGFAGLVCLFPATLAFRAAVPPSCCATPFEAASKYADRVIGYGMMAKRDPDGARLYACSDAAQTRSLAALKSLTRVGEDPRFSYSTLFDATKKIDADSAIVPMMVTISASIDGVMTKGIRWADVATESHDGDWCVENVTPNTKNTDD
ncbi:hypothetical protein [Longispora albida]|uniref:hypothetical protein n=1 Tax=Longispora albida TaxID=203523 RepID=UPI0012F8F128|nr:hypothetical protein [Longispora albida]